MKTPTNTIADRLSAHLAKIASGRLSDSRTHRLMALLRELLEVRDERKVYPTLTMFCDWSLHPKLDRSTLGNELLDIIDTIWAQTANADDQVRVVTRRLSPSTLRDELFKLLANSRIDPSVVANDLPYRKLVTLLIADLLGKPISRSETARSKRDADHLAKGIRFVADRISFNQNEKLETELRLVSRQLDPPSDGEVHIVIPWLAAPKE